MIEMFLSSLLYYSRYYGVTVNCVPDDINQLLTAASHDLLVTRGRSSKASRRVIQLSRKYVLLASEERRLRYGMLRTSHFLSRKQ